MARPVRRVPAPNRFTRVIPYPNCPEGPSGDGLSLSRLITQRKPYTGSPATSMRSRRQEPLTGEQLTDLRLTGGIDPIHVTGPLPGMTERELAPDIEPNLVLEQTNRLGFFSPPRPPEAPSEAARHPRADSPMSDLTDGTDRMADAPEPAAAAPEPAAATPANKRGTWFFDPFSRPPTNKFKSAFTMKNNPMFKYTFFDT